MRCGGRCRLDRPVVYTAAGEKARFWASTASCFAFSVFTLVKEQLRLPPVDVEGPLFQVQFTVNLADLKRSSRRLLTRLSDESEAGGDFVVFNATGDGLQIVANSTSEGLTPIVSNAGVARIPYPVFRGIVGTFSTYHMRKFTLTISPRRLERLTAR